MVSDSYLFRITLLVKEKYVETFLEDLGVQQSLAMTHLSQWVRCKHNPVTVLRVKLSSLILYDDKQPNQKP